MASLIFFISCKKDPSPFDKRIMIKQFKSDTIQLEDKDQVIFINPTTAYIDSLKKSYKNKDDFYTMADDANFYNAEAGDFILKNRVDTINIENKNILKLGQKVISLSMYKPWTLLLYHKGKKPLNIYPIDIEKEFFNYFEKENSARNNINEILKKNHLNSSNIIYNNEIKNGDNNLNIIIIAKDDNFKNIVFLQKSNDNYSLILNSDTIIPCEECGNGGDTFYDYKVNNDILSFSSSYKTNEDIYNINFTFKKHKEKIFLLDNVTISESRIGGSTGKHRILNKDNFGEIGIQEFNYMNFISNNILK
ncbi:hypothetical protein [Chryseobacterium sp. MMS23-Vi53]|uniref:hypothetical protein n=1 Tax=Chryseobacterium sp. MMS23-Vi53 TaxID=3386644 RepID=UPI0039EACC3C